MFIYIANSLSIRATQDLVSKIKCVHVNTGKLQRGACVKMRSNHTSQNGFQLQEGKEREKNCVEETDWGMEGREGAKEAEGKEAEKSWVGID